MSSSSLSIDWIKQNLQFNTTYDDTEPSITSDASGNIYLVYTTTGTVSGATRINTASGSAYTQIVIVKMNSSGNVVWIKQPTALQTIDSATNNAIDTDNNGNVYVSFAVWRSTSGQVALGVQSDIVVTKLNSNGDVQWLLQNPILNTVNSDYARNINVVKSTGTMYISYLITGASSGNTYLGSQDIAVAKILTDGTISWVRQSPLMNTTAADGQSGLTMSVNANEDIILSYITQGTVSGGIYMGLGDIVFARMNSSGDVVWVKYLSNLNTTAYQFWPTIVADTEHIYCLYQTDTAVSGGTKVGGWDLVLTKLTVADGSIVYIKENSTFNAASGTVNQPIALQFARDGNLIAMVYTQGTTPLPGQPTSTVPNRVALIKFYKSNGNVIGIDQNPLFSSLSGSGQTYSGYFRSQLSQLMTVGSDGSYIFTYQTNTTTSGNTNVGDISTTNQGDIVVFKAKDGVVEWVQQNNSLSTTSADGNSVVKTDTSGNIYVAYETNGTVSGGGGKIGNNYNIVYAKLNSSGVLQWVFQSSNLNRNQLSTFYAGTPNLVVDSASGMMYISYYTTGTVSGAGNVNASGATSTNNDIVVAKISTSAGAIQWIKQNPTFNTPGNDLSVSTRPVGMVLTSSGLYCTYTVVSSTSGNSMLGGGQDICVFRLNTSTGNTDWIRQNNAMNTTAADATPTIAADSTGNVYIAYTVYSATSGGTYYPGGSGQDIAVMKMNSSGSVLWVKQNPTFNSSSLDNIPSIAVNSANEIIVAAHTISVISGGTAAGVTGSTRDIYVWKMDSSTGATIWSRQTPLLNSNANETNATLVCDSSNNIYIGYETQGAVSGGTFAGTSDIVVSKMDTNGNVLEVKQYPALNSSASETRAMITLDASGAVVGTYATNSEIPGALNVSRMRNDIVVVKTREASPTIVRTGDAVTLSYSAWDSGSYSLTYYKSVDGVSTALSGNSDTLTKNVLTSYYVSYTNADGVVYNSPLSTTIYLVVSNPPVTTVQVTRQPTTNNAYIYIPETVGAESYRITNNYGLDVTISAVPNSFIIPGYPRTVYIDTSVKQPFVYYDYYVTAISQYGNSEPVQGVGSFYSNPGPTEAPTVTRSGLYNIALSYNGLNTPNYAIKYYVVYSAGPELLGGTTHVLSAGYPAKYVAAFHDPDTGVRISPYSAESSTYEWLPTPAITMQISVTSLKATVTLSTSVASATSYTLTGTSGLSVSGLTAANFPYTDQTILDPFTMYTYTITAVNSYGTSSAYTTPEYNYSPGPTGTVSAVRNGSTVTLSYNGTDVGGYTVDFFRYVNGSLSGQTVGSTTYTIVKGTFVTFRAIFRQAGKTASGTIGISSLSNRVEYLSDPAISLTYNTTTRLMTVNLVTAVSSATSYTLSGSSGLSVSGLTSGSFPYTDPAVLTDATSYTYSIRAVNAYGDSDMISASRFTNPAAPTSAPTVSRSSGTVTLSYGGNDLPAGGSVLYYSSTDGSTYTSLGAGVTSQSIGNTARFYKAAFVANSLTSSMGPAVETLNTPAISLTYSASTRRMTVNLDTASSNATSYTLTGTSGLSVSGLTTGSFPYTDSTVLTGATSYTYTLQAFGTNSSSEQASASRYTNPAAPTSAPTASRSGETVTLSYGGNDLPAGGSVLYYVSTNGTSYTSLGAGVTTDTIAPNATRYYVCTFVANGVESATFSSSASVFRASVLIQAFSSKAGIYFSISSVPESATSLVISRDGSATPVIATIAAPIPSSYEDTNVVVGTTYTYTFTVHNSDNTTIDVPVTATWAPSSYVIIPYGEVVIKAVSRTAGGLIQITYNSDIAGYYKILFGDGTWVDTTCEILLEVGVAHVATIENSDQLDDGIYKIANTLIERSISTIDTDNIIYEIATIDTAMVVPPVIVPVTGPSYDYTLYNIKTTVENDRVAIVAPFKGTYDGTTTADIGVIGMSDQQYYTGIDAVFEYILTEEDSVRLLNTFNVRDTNVFPSPLYAVGQEGYTTEQDSLHFEVDLAHKPEFMDILRTTMAISAQTTGKTLPNVKAYFEEEMRVELNLQLQQSGLIDMLEASNVSDVNVDLDISGGAYSMAEAIDASGAHANLKRKQFLTQIPLATLRSYMAEAQPFLGFLPLRGADSMTFVFDVNVEAPSELTAKPDGSGATYADPAVVPNIHFDTERRQIAFIFHLTNRKSMFCPDVECVDAHMTDAILTRFPDASGSAFTVDDVFYAARDFFDVSPFVLRANYTNADIARLDAAAAQPALADATTPAEKRAVGLARFKASAALEYKTQRDQATLQTTRIGSITNVAANSPAVTTSPLTITYANNRITVSAPEISTIALAPLYYYMVGDIEGTGPWQTMIPLTWSGTSLYADNVVFGSYGGFKIYGYMMEREAPYLAPWMDDIHNGNVNVSGSATADGTAYLVYRSSMDYFQFNHYDADSMNGQPGPVVDSLNANVGFNMFIPTEPQPTGLSITYAALSVVEEGDTSGRIILETNEPFDPSLSPLEIVYNGTTYNAVLSTYIRNRVTSKANYRTPVSVSIPTSLIGETVQIGRNGVFTNATIVKGVDFFEVPYMTTSYDDNGDNTYNLYFDISGGTFPLIMNYAQVVDNDTGNLLSSSMNTERTRITLQLSGGAVPYNANGFVFCIFAPTTACAYGVSFAPPTFVGGGDSGSYNITILAAKGSWDATANGGSGADITTLQYTSTVAGSFSLRYAQVPPGAPMTVDSNAGDATFVVSSTPVTTSFSGYLNTGNLQGVGFAYYFGPANDHQSNTFAMSVALGTVGPYGQGYAGFGDQSVF